MNSFSNYIQISIVLLLTSCSGFLDLNPISEIGEEAFYKNETEVGNAVVACYNGLMNPISNEWTVTELRSDNTSMNPDNSEAVYTEFRQLDYHIQSSQNPLINTYWQDTYHNIARANKVLENLGVITDTDKSKQYDGEARFIRAYHYFNLVRLFGPVPVITKSISGEEAKTYERSTVGEVYGLIENDLKTAVVGLPTQYANSDKGRVTKWTASALLAKVYLTQKKFNEAAPLLSDIISNSGHSLLQDYASVFSISNEMNSEILFAVRFMSGNVGLGSQFANLFAPRSSGDNVINGDGTGHNYPTTSIIEAYEQGDARKDASLKENWYNQTSKVTIDRAYITKFLSQVTVPRDAENDWPVIRYSDVLLMYAEVKNQIDGPEEALPYLNQVRQRVDLDPLTSEQITNKYEFSIALDQERRVEFAFENHRYFDLLRNGKIVDVINQHYQLEPYYNDPVREQFKADPILEWQTILPIPQRELDINPKLTQNLNY